MEYRELDEVLSCSNIISLNLPLNEETRGFISRDKIGFACIDVFDMEPPLPADYPLLHAKNTLLTPHQAYISEEAMERRAEIVFGNVYAWLKGEPENVIR